MKEHDISDVEWELTTWEGSRRQQLRDVARLTLRERLQAVEEMARLSERLRKSRESGRAGQESDSRNASPDAESV